MKSHMNFKPYVFALLAGILLAAASVQAEEHADETPQMFGVRHVELAAGTHHQFKSWLSEQMFPALREGGARAAWVWDFVTGPADTVVIAHPLENFAAWDVPGPAERVMDSDQLRELFGQLTPWVRNHRYEIMRARPDLSTREAPPEHVMVVCGVTVRPGHGEEFERMIVEDYHPVVREAGVPFAVSQQIFGSGVDYVMFHDLPDFAALDLGAPALRVLDEEQRTELNNKFAANVGKFECNVVHYDAETSFEVEEE